MFDTKKIQELLAKLPEISPTSADLDGFGRDIVIPVPDELLAWLQLASGPCVPSRLFGLPMRRDIASAFDYPSWKQKKWVPVGTDGCGNYYLLATQQEFGKGFPIIFVDTMESSGAPSYLVASDIGHFLVFFLEDEINRPVIPEEAWPFGEDYVIKRDPGILGFSKELLPWEVDKKSRGA